jgi:hypothetical protein
MRIVAIFTMIPSFLFFPLAAWFFVVFVLGCQSRHQAFPLGSRTRCLDRAAGLCRMRGAAVIPARRVASIDPMQALRSE